MTHALSQNVAVTRRLALGLAASALRTEGLLLAGLLSLLGLVLLVGLLLLAPGAGPPF